MTLAAGLFGGALLGVNRAENIKRLPRWAFIALAVVVCLLILLPVVGVGLQ